MIASLGMYDMPALQSANDRFWHAIHTHLSDGPQHLTRDGDAWDIWQSPDLWLAQTCGMPYRTRLHDHVKLVGTPDYGIAGCPPGYYCSVLVARADRTGTQAADFASGKFAYNDAMSQSGWAGPMTHFAAKGVNFGKTLETGSHAQSAQAVAQGRADMAGIDALTWALLSEHSDITQNLRVIETTAPTPGLPYITAPARDAVKLARAVAAAMMSLDEKDRATLHFKGLVQIPVSEYLAIPTPPAP